VNIVHVRVLGSCSNAVTSAQLNLTWFMQLDSKAGTHKVNNIMMAVFPSVLLHVYTGHTVHAMDVTLAGNNAQSVILTSLPNFLKMPR
jgi:hypothetical protein